MHRQYHAEYIASEIAVQQQFLYMQQSQVKTTTVTRHGTDLHTYNSSRTLSLTKILPEDSAHVEDRSQVVLVR